MKRAVVGGTKAGNGAWGLAWVDTVMEAPFESANSESKARMVRESGERV